MKLQWILAAIATVATLTNAQVVDNRNLLTKPLQDDSNNQDYIGRRLTSVGPPKKERDRVVKEANGYGGRRLLRSWPNPLEEDPDSYDYPSGRVLTSVGPPKKERDRVVKEANGYGGRRLLSNIVEARDLQNSPEKGEKYHQIDHHN